MATCAHCGFESNETFRFCPECGAASAQGPATFTHEQRKTVTVLFCDLAGSTALGETLDPERLRALLARYFERMKSIVEHHGGTVEKFIGDAVMAVFGVPAVHEDDALRAVRAAVEMRDALPELGLEGRIGVMTGEVVTGTEERSRPATRSTSPRDSSRRLRPARCWSASRHSRSCATRCEVEAVGPLALKGKAEPVPAYRLMRCGTPRNGDTTGRSWDATRARACS